MNIFKKLNEKESSTIKYSTSPNELFYQIKKDEKFSYLRDVQKEVLDDWQTKREDEHQIIKMNTGAGKTLVGLIILFSKLQEKKKKCVYLCPDRQLVNQVIEQSKSFNIPTCFIGEDREFPEEFLNNKSILVTTVQRLFNGKNIFDKQKIEIDSIVIDDAHKCVEKIRSSFTIKIDFNHELYSKLLALFEGELKRQSLGTFESISRGHSDYYMKLPFWEWIDKQGKVIEILSEYTNDKETLLFTWDLFSNNVHQYEFYINSSKIEISPIKCFTENIQSYYNAKHKYALSATFENNLSLLFDLDFPIDSIKLPISPNIKNDFGQRLILSPKRYFSDYDDDNTQEIIKHHLDNKQNIIVLVPSFRKAEKWKGFGAKIIRNNIEEEIENLRNTDSNFIVLVNRYDGIDVGGNACNILIIDDHPKHKYIKDKYIETILYSNKNNLIAQTIEQGIGRTVRSRNDYSVVYLFGRNLLRFLRQKSNFNYLNKHTRKQIEIGLDLLSGENIDSKDISKTIYQTADYCLNQEPDWLNYYQSQIQNIGTNTKNSEIIQLEIKAIEREAALAFIKKDYLKADKLIDEIFKTYSTISESQRAILFIEKANFIYPINKDVSNDLVLKARNFSRHVFETSLSTTYSKRQVKTENQIIKSLDLIKTFDSANDLISHIKEIESNLIYDENHSHEYFEDSLHQLGNLLGYKSLRPEKENNEGPDVLWILNNNNCLVLEAKSEKKNKNKINKKEIGQLQQSITWFQNNYINDNIKTFGVTLQPLRYKESDVQVNENLKVIDSQSLSELKDSINNLIEFFQNCELNELTSNSLNLEFELLHFKANQFGNKYLKKIK